MASVGVTVCQSGMTGKLSSGYPQVFQCFTPRNVFLAGWIQLHSSMAVFSNWNDTTNRMFRIGKAGRGDFAGTTV